MIAGEGDTRDVATLEGFSRAVAWLVLALACAVVVGWLFGIEILTSVAPGYTTMKFNTALCLGALACSVLVRHQGVSRGLAGAAGLVAAANLVEIAFDVRLGIDELVVTDPTAVKAAPGQMATATAVGLVVLAAARNAIASRLRRLAQTLLLVPLGISVTALLGYLYDVEQLYRVASLSSVALHTAAGLLLLTASLAAKVPGGMLPWIARGSGPGAQVVRQTVPVVVIGLVALGFVRMQLGDAGAFGEHFGIALMVMVSIVIAVGATVRAAVRLEVTDQLKQHAEAALRELNLSLVEGRDQAWARAESLAEDLARERQRFDRAVAGTESVVWTVETTSGEPVPVYTSSNAERVLGDRLLPGETATAALARLVDEDQRGAALDFRRRVRAGTPAEVELGLRIGGAAKWVRVHGVPRDEGGQTFYDGIITDVTEAHGVAEQRERLLAQEVLQVERLSELNRVRDEFIAVAGHELRTPVAVILGYLEMLSDANVSDQIRTESMEVLNRRALQLSELVERVFDLAKIDSGLLQFNLEAVRCDAFVEEMLVEHLPAAEAKGVSLSATAGPLTVMADAPRLQQVFDNLMSNAIKYTPEGGHVTVESALHGDRVTFTVTDDGIGVAPEEMPRLFDRLFRANSARDARIPGTGLGLAVTKALVEGQGGVLTARANQPRGLVFEVSLPVAPALMCAAEVR